MAHLLLGPRCPVRQVARQRHAQTRIRPQLHVVDVLIAAASLQLLDEATDLLEVTLAQAARVCQEFRILFQAAEESRLLERKGQLEAVKDVPDDDFMAAM